MQVRYKQTTHTHIICVYFPYTRMSIRAHTVQLRYKQTLHTCIIRAYFAYMHMSICAYIHVYMHVYTCVYVSLLFIPTSFFVGQTNNISGWKEHQVSTWNLHIEQTSLKVGVFNCCASSPTNYCLLTLTWSIAAKKLRRKLKQSLKLLISTNCFHSSNITCNVYSAVYGCEQVSGAKNYFAGSFHSFWMK